MDSIAGYDPDGTAGIEAASRTSRLFMKTLRQYDPIPFDGEVDAILSKDRAIWGADPNDYLRSLSNQLRIHEVGRNHKNLFREHLAEVAKTVSEILRIAS